MPSPARHPQAREKIASAVQYALLGGFAATAAGISAQGLTGFARANMGLRGPWPYLLFFSLDGAAGVCAVLLARRAARGESGLAPRLAVWGLVAASASFNWTHAPRRPASPEAFGLMPLIAALLFEFCLREMRQRTAGRADRKLSALRLLRPAELARVQLDLAGDSMLSAGEATRQVQVKDAARRVYQLGTLLHAHDRATKPSRLAARRIRAAEHRAQHALIRAGFSDPLTAFAVARQIQVLTQTTALARLDYRTAEAAREFIANLIASPAAPSPAPSSAARTADPASGDAAAVKIPVQIREDTATLNGHRRDATQPIVHPAAATAEAPPVPAAASPGTVQRQVAADLGDRELDLAGAARRIVTDARKAGVKLTKVALAEKLRSQGYTVANSRLRWLAAESSLETGQDGEPDRRAGSGR